MFQHYFRTSGTATKSEVWGVFVVYLLLGLAARIFIAVRGAELLGLLAFLLALAALTATICTIGRRLNALGKSKYWALLMFVPLINFVLLIYAGTAKAREE